MLQIFVTYLESNDSVLSIKNRIFYSEKSGWITTKLTVDNLVVTTYNGADDETRTHNKTGVGILSGTLYTPAFLPTEK